MEAIARSLELSKGVVVKYCQLAGAANIDWKSVQDWDEARLRSALMPNVRIPAIVTAHSKFIVTDKLLMLEGAYFT